MGAWIETAAAAVAVALSESHPTWVRGLKLAICIFLLHLKVAPYVGAWIETSVLLSLSKMKIVAPYVGAWIETSDCVTTTTTTPSRTLRGCVD